MTTPTTPPQRAYSRFAIALLVGGLLAIGAGSTTLHRANALEANSTVVSAVVTEVGDRRGRFVPVTYRYEAEDRQLEKTVMVHHSLVENWAASRQVQARVAKDRPEESDLVENRAPVGSGMQWIVFGVLATGFGTLRLRRRPEEA